MSDSRPSVIVVGDQALADFLQEMNPNWFVCPAAPTVNDMWDRLDNRDFPDDASVVIFTEGTGESVDELEQSIVAFAPYAATFLVADPSRGEIILRRIAELAASTEGADPDQPVNLMPANDIDAALAVLQAGTGDIVHWEEEEEEAPPAPVVAPAPVAPPVAPAPTQVEQPTQTPQEAHSAPPVAPAPPVAAVAPVEHPKPVPTPSPNLGYEQAAVYPTQTAMQAGLDYVKPENARPGQTTIAVMSSKGGVGKCGPGHILIQDGETGVLRRLDSIVEDGKTTTVPGFDGRFIAPQAIKTRIYSGEKKTFTLKLRSGRTVSATANHPLLTTEGYRRLDSIEVGETLATPSKVPFPTKPVRLDEAELDLLAIIMAEGGTSTASTNVTSNDPEIVRIASEATENMGLLWSSHSHPMQFGISGVVRIDTKSSQDRCGCESSDGSILTDCSSRKATDHMTTRDHVLRRFRRVHRLSGVLAKNKTMPEAVYRLPEDQLARFISLFWMCDGYVVSKNSGDVGITLASKELVKAFQHLLLRFGIQSSFRYRTGKANGKTFDAWRVTVLASSYPAFAAKIPLWDHKAENMETLLERQANGKSNPNTGCPTFSDKVYANIVAQRPLDDKTFTRRISERLGWNVKTHLSPSMVLFHKASKDSGRKHLNMKGLRAWCEVAGIDAEAEFGWIYDSEIYWDEVVSVESDGINKVYDLEIPSVHNFVANDVVMHNSTISMCLAAEIALSSSAAGDPKSVVLVDLDTRDGQVGSLLGQYMPTAVNIRVMPRWDADTVTSKLVHDKRLGIDALLAPVRPRNADDVGPEFYREIISVLQTTHDVVIIDCSVNYLDPLLGTAFMMADEILFATTLATTSVQGMARSLTELFADVQDGGLGIPKEKVGVVANQVINNVGMGKDKLLRAALGAPLVGQIPAEQDTVLIATNTNRLGNLLTHPRLGSAFYRLAVTCLPGAALAPLVQSEAPQHSQAASVVQPEKKGFFRR